MPLNTFSDIIKPYIVAEISGNHCQDLGFAIELVREAASAGVDAVKVQTYTADSMTMKLADERFMANRESAWAGEYLYDLYSRAALPYEWHHELSEVASQEGIVFFSSPFDEVGVDFLDSLNVPFFKIASFECIDLPLIRYAAGKGKPLIISTGMATLDEVSEAFNAALTAGLSVNQIMLLKCTSNYPASISDANIAAMRTLQETFGCHVGLSDHTIGNDCAQIALAAGASLIEKHFVLRERKDLAVDGHFSADEEDLSNLVMLRNKIHAILGSPVVEPTANEELSRAKRRSVIATRFIKAGERLSETNIRRLRPGHGLHPRHYEEILGKTTTVDVNPGDPIIMSDLS